MKTFSDLKRRLQVGTEIQLIGWTSLDGKQDFLSHHKGAFVKRYVSRVQTNGIWLGMADNKAHSSFLDWPPAKQVTFVDEDTFELRGEEGPGARVLRYKIGAANAASTK